MAGRPATTVTTRPRRPRPGRSRPRSWPGRLPAHRLAAGRLDRTCEPVLPDEVLGEDRDAGGHPNASARWWKTSRAVTTPVGWPFWRIGMWRNPPTAIRWMARAIGSVWRSVTGFGVITSAIRDASSELPATRTTA